MMVQKPTSISAIKRFSSARMSKRNNFTIGQIYKSVIYTLRLGGGVTVAGQARVVNVRLQPSNVRVALAFQNVAEAVREKLEVEVFDTVLGQLRS